MKFSSYGKSPVSDKPDTEFCSRCLKNVDDCGRCNEDKPDTQPKEPTITGVDFGSQNDCSAITVRLSDGRFVCGVEGEIMYDVLLALHEALNAPPAEQPITPEIHDAFTRSLRASSEIVSPAVEQELVDSIKMIQKAFPKYKPTAGEILTRTLPESFVMVVRDVLKDCLDALQSPVQGVVISRECAESMIARADEINEMAGIVNGADMYYIELQAALGDRE